MINSPIQLCSWALPDWLGTRTSSAYTAPKARFDKQMRDICWKNWSVKRREKATEGRRKKEHRYREGHIISSLCRTHTIWWYFQHCIAFSCLKALYLMGCSLCSSYHVKSASIRHRCTHIPFLVHFPFTRIKHGCELYRHAQVTVQGFSVRLTGVFNPFYFN